MADAEVVILSATRTPIGSLCGSLSTLKAHQLGSIAIKSAISQARLSPSDITEVILGQALTGGQGQNPARQAAIGAEIPVTTCAYSVNMLCGSGLKAVALGYQSILTEPSAIVVAGGQESMTQAPHCLNIRNGVKMGDTAIVDSMLIDGLTDAFNNIHMGLTAENIAKEKNISRPTQDAFALESQNKAASAISNNLFEKEITPVTVTVKGKPIVIAADEHPRPSTTSDSLAKLKPVFDPSGTVTAGNASGINDGAAVVVLTSASTAAARKLQVRARIVGSAQAGVSPLVMGLGPVPAIQTLLKKIGWNKDEVDLYELNEAFAVQSYAVIKELDLNTAKVNVNGGAIALGHPIGASGARILVTLLHALEQKNAKRGVAALCIGGGMGIALAIERS